MTAYLLKWATASLLMPLVVLLFGKALNNLLILIFWPGSIVLMSLGAEEKSLSQVIYVWSVAISLNIFLYLLIGLAFHFIFKLIKG